MSLQFEKQNLAPTCLACAMFNVGMIDRDTLEVYKQRDKEFRAAESTYSLESFLNALERAATFEDDRFDFSPTEKKPLNEEKCTGSPAMVRKWLMDCGQKALADWMWVHMPHNPLAMLDKIMVNSAKNERPDPHARGVALVYCGIPFLGMGGAHAVAYENGMVSDSGDGSPSRLETWDEFAKRASVCALTGFVPCKIGKVGWWTRVKLYLTENVFNNDIPENPYNP